MARTSSSSGVRARRKGSTVAAISAVVALTIAGCSSSSGTKTSAAASGGPSASGSSESCLTAANAFLKPYDTLATSLPASYTPLSHPPARGGSVIAVIGVIPSEEQVAEGVQSGAKAVGWTGSTIHHDGNVGDANVKLEQAIAQHPTMITMAGWPYASLAKSLADAKKAGIVVVLGAQINQPTGYPGFAAAVQGGPTYGLMGKIDAFQFMRDSNCSGSVDVVTLAGYPVLEAGDKEFDSTVATYCPRCEVTTTAVQATDIGTATLTSAIVSQLQTKPSIGYVRIDVGSSATGLAIALKQASLDRVKIFGDIPDAAGIAALRNGTNAWWVNYASQLSGYSMFDAGLRALAAKASVSDTGRFPLALLTPKNVPSGQLPVVPSNYEQLFAQLWTGH